ncbi:hypothetical protein ACFYV7_15345 [Nocardia suismassiliense]|uniref:Secreted protein n=1 Tax=Nocardia suismassiliense TaxID=2077092 RepID=A0ABW6QTF2_9NOCA
MDVVMLVGAAGASVVVALIVLLVVAVQRSMRAERARKTQLWEWSRAHGWSYTERARAEWTSRLPGRNPRGLGVVMTGHLGGRWVTVADYKHETSSSDGSSTTHHYIVIVVRLAQPHLPVSVLSRGSLSQLGRSLFGDKPTATGNPTFDYRYRVVAPDPHYARRLIGPQLITAHLYNAVPHWSLAGQDLLTYHKGQLRHPKAIPALAAPLLHVAELLPP